MSNFLFLQGLTHTEKVKYSNCCTVISQGPTDFPQQVRLAEASQGC